MTTTLPDTFPELGPVTLNTANLPALSEFYRTLLGLDVQAVSEREHLLSVHGTPLLRLLATPDLPRAAASRPGLYHTAFLLPSRADLGCWLAHAAGLGLRLGSGDHLVSEAFYLSDPEGNGIEVYHDRPREEWQWQGGQVKMDTLAVDVAGVLGAAGISPEALQRSELPAYAGVPAGTRIGHVHLKVGNAAQAAQFYAEALGLELVSGILGAAFVSWGQYHHHLGLNEWHTRGQPKPTGDALGLAALDVLTPDLAGLRARWQGRPDVTDNGDLLTLTDPWGNKVQVRQQTSL